MEISKFLIVSNLWNKRVQDEILTVFYKVIFAVLTVCIKLIIASVVLKQQSFKSKCNIFIIFLSLLFEVSVLAEYENRK